MRYIIAALALILLIGCGTSTNVACDEASCVYDDPNHCDNHECGRDHIPHP